MAADTPEYVELEARGATLEIRLSARSAASARATLEDLFACLKAAERTLDADGGTAPALRPAPEGPGPKGGYVRHGAADPDGAAEPR